MAARARAAKRSKRKKLKAVVATKTGLKRTAAKIGSAIGKVDSVAHDAANRATTAVKAAKREFIGLSRQLNKSGKRLTLALKG